jgi:hypothetical protein
MPMYCVDQAKSLSLMHLEHLSQADVVIYANQSQQDLRHYRGFLTRSC